MNILVIVGSHKRNLSLLKKLHENKRIKIVGIILCVRGNLIPEPDKNLSPALKKLWNLHFKRREVSEKKYFDFDENILLDHKNLLKIDNSELLNSDQVIEFVQKINIDSCFISGAPIIKKKLLEKLPENTINLHLGLIPDYKGSITMFWPFYNLEPAMAGTTYHIIDEKVDTGEILHQSIPNLSKGDGMHEVACKSIKSALDDLEIVINHIIERIKKNIKPKKDQSLIKKGKLFKSSDWKPEMLKKIYDIYDDKIVDLYLAKKINSRLPILKKIKKLNITLPNRIS